MFVGIPFLFVIFRFRIGVATKPKCEKVLQAVSWDLEQAASRLLDSL